LKFEVVTFPIEISGISHDVLTEIFFVFFRLSKRILWLFLR